MSQKHSCPCWKKGRKNVFSAVDKQKQIKPLTVKKLKKKLMLKLETNLFKQLIGVGRELSQPWCKLKICHQLNNGNFHLVLEFSYNKSIPYPFSLKWTVTFSIGPNGRNLLNTSSFVVLLDIFPMYTIRLSSYNHIEH